MYHDDKTGYYYNPFAPEKDIQTMDDVPHIHPKMQEFGAALQRFIKANDELEKGMNNVPDYTGQYNAEDFYAAEQHEWNKAVFCLYMKLRNLE